MSEVIKDPVETEAERELRLAEAEKHRADAARAAVEAEAARVKARAEAAKNFAEARKEVALAETYELELVEARHVADRAKEKRARELATDEHHHVYRFDGAVDNSSVAKCREQLNYWRRNATDDDEKKVEIIFYSPGGSVLAGMALFDYISELRREGWHFTTVVRGYAASMGGILLQAGDERVCGPESYILIHEVSSGAVGKIGELEDEIEFVKLIQSRVNSIFVARSGGKVTSAKLRSMYRRKDFWLDSDNALKLGICDRIG